MYDGLCDRTSESNNPLHHSIDVLLFVLLHMSLQVNNTAAKSLATLPPAEPQLGAKIYNVPFQAVKSPQEEHTEVNLELFHPTSKVELLHFGTF